MANIYIKVSKGSMPLDRSHWIEVHINLPYLVSGIADLHRRRHEGVPTVCRVRGGEVAPVTAAVVCVRRRHLPLHVDSWASVSSGLVSGFLHV